MANRMVLNETSYFGWNARENLVDRVMRNYKDGRYERFNRRV